MEQKIKTYVDGLFAAVPQTQKSFAVKSETLGRLMLEYDRLTAQGEAPEVAYEKAVASLGDVNAILAVAGSNMFTEPSDEAKLQKRKLLTAIAVALYILCPVPVILIQNEIGVCLMFALIAFATGLIIASSVSGKKGKVDIQKLPEEKSGDVSKAVCSAWWAVVIAGYFIVSFLTFKWHITWIIFLIGAAVEGIIKAVFELARKDDAK